jgi:hypothetical protein
MSVRGAIKVSSSCAQRKPLPPPAHGSRAVFDFLAFDFRLLGVASKALIRLAGVAAHSVLSDIIDGNVGVRRPSL